MGVVIVTYRCVGGGLRPQSSDLSSAGIIAITVFILAIVLCLIAATYCIVRRAQIFRRRYNGGRASDYVDRRDVGAQMPSPPPYDAHTMPLPPPYSSIDKPPDYEVVLLRDGRCLYRPRTESETAAESDAADDLHHPSSSVATSNQ